MTTTNPQYMTQPMASSQVTNEYNNLNDNTLAHDM